MRFYSKTTGGFYDDSIHGTMPSDAVEVSDSTYSQLFSDQEVGKIITADENGNPVSVTPSVSGNQAIFAQILDLQNSITLRMKIEAAAGSVATFSSGANAGKTAQQVITEVQSQIDSLRSQLT